MYFWVISQQNCYHTFYFVSIWLISKATVILILVHSSAFNPYAFLLPYCGDHSITGFISFGCPSLFCAHFGFFIVFVARDFLGLRILIVYSFLRINSYQRGICLLVVLIIINIIVIFVDSFISIEFTLFFFITFVSINLFYILIFAKLNQG